METQKEENLEISNTDKKGKNYPKQLNLYLIIAIISGVVEAITAETVTDFSNKYNIRYGFWIVVIIIAIILFVLNIKRKGKRNILILLKWPLINIIIVVAGIYIIDEIRRKDEILLLYNGEEIPVFEIESRGIDEYNEIKSTIHFLRKIQNKQQKINKDHIILLQIKETHEEYFNQIKKLENSFLIGHLNIDEYKESLIFNLSKRDSLIRKSDSIKNTYK